MTSNKQFIEFQEKIGTLKHLRRTGWVIRGVPDAETVASHSWRMAVMAIQKENELKEMGADVDKIIKMALTHDIGEAVIGDIIPERHQTADKKISNEEKKAKETEAVHHLATQYAFPKLKKLFDEHEAGKTLEAKIVKNLDKLDMLLQAYEYKKQYPDIQRLDEFMTYNADTIDIPIFQKELNEIKSRQFDTASDKNIKN